MSRTQKSSRNLMFALISQVLIIGVKFFTRTALINTLGIEAVSINALLSEVVAMLSLAELGVGTAIVYNLYAPLAVGDHKKISQYMGLFKKAYQIVALLIFVIGIAFIPFLPKIINDLSYSMSYIRVIYMLFVVQTAGSYLFSYKTALLNADQKNYIFSIIYVSTKTVGAVVLIAVLYFTKSLIAFMCVNVIITLSINFIASLVVDKQYSYLGKHDILPVEERKEVFSNIKNIFIKSLSGKITTSTDNILISTLVSTVQVGYYSNYNIFFAMVYQLSLQFGGSINASMGNFLSTESSEKSAEMLKRMTFLFYLISACGILCLYAAITPFIKLWIGDEFLLEPIIVTICCFNSFLAFMRAPLWGIMNVSGLFKQDKNIAIVGSVANLIISIGIGLKFGMIGIFLGTIMSGLIQLFLKSNLLFREKFQLSPFSYYRMWVFGIISMMIQLWIVNNLADRIRFDNLIVELLLKLVMAVGIFAVVNFLLYFRTKEFAYALSLVKRFVGNKLLKKTIEK